MLVTKDIKFGVGIKLIILGLLLRTKCFPLRGVWCVFMTQERDS